jgi:hypothetical protein
MEFQIQHSGKGKLHLLGEDFKPLCGTKAYLDFNYASHAEVTDGILYEIHNNSFSIYTSICRTKIENPFEYCKTCLNKVIKK